MDVENAGMVIKSAEFVLSGEKPAHYPPEELPEIAFAGRSNVGKSSLLNTLLNRRRLAKISAKPGCTRMINFFRINQSFWFVDLPGYGYARVPVSVRRKWAPMVETYLSSRRTLKGVILLQDIRRIPGVEELGLISYLKAHNIPLVPVLTKADKLPRSRQSLRRTEIGKVFGILPSSLYLFSALSRMGRDEIWTAIQRLLTDAPDAGPTDGYP